MKRAIYITVIFSFFCKMLPAQTSPGRVINPLAGTTVPNEELFIVFQKNNELRWEDYTVKVYLDGMDYSSLIKLQGDLLTVLATHRMKPGTHKITVRLTAKGMMPLESSWTFQTEGKGIPALPNAQAERPTFSMRSDLQLQSRLTGLSGPGQALRQEPPSLQTFNFLGSAFHNNLEIPFRFYITNQERSSLQWRNTYMIGLKTKRLGLYAGDVFPVYQRHVVNGSKIRGGRASVKLRNTTFDLSYGNIQRSLEGQLRQYDVALGFPPVNLETGTGLYIVPGSYRRDVLAAQVRFDSKRTKGETTFSFLRGTDRASSIEFGGPAGENIVFGFGHKTSSKNKALVLDLGISGSLTTRDARSGAASNSELQDIYGRESAVDPASLESFFVINASTTPLRITGLPSVSAFANARLNVLRQHFTMQYERVGSSFYSYGIPFLINDRRTLAISDWVHLWKQRIMLSANYRYFTNNLSGQKPLTQETGHLQTSLRFRPGPAWPQLMFSYSDFRRRGEDVVLKKETMKRSILTWTAGVFHNFKIGETQQSVNFSYSRNNRHDGLRDNSDFFTDAINVRLSSDVTKNFQVSAEYQFLLLSNDTSDFNRQNGYGLRLRYQTPGKKFNLSAGARQFRTAETFFTPEANRRMLDGRVEYAVRNDLAISVQVGRSEYREAFFENRRYDETWGEAGLRYRWR